MAQQTLKSFFSQHPKVALAFSGGSDSAYLFAEARRYGADVRAYYVRTHFQAREDTEHAISLAIRLKADLRILTVDVFADPQIVANSAARCYHCKRLMFETLWRAAQHDRFDVLIDGTNASDSVNDRPGMQALMELGVMSPLRMAGLTKDMIRDRSKNLRLSTWDRPANACLATRIPTGESLCKNDLLRVAAAERALAALGYSDLRVRVFHGAARIQVPVDQMRRLVDDHDQVRAGLSPFFSPVLLDLQPR